MDINGPRIAIALVIFAAFLFIQRKQKKISDSYLERLKRGPKAEMERLAALDDEEELRDAAEGEAAGEDGETEDRADGAGPGGATEPGGETPPGATDGRA